jgi:ribonuclease HI
MVSGILWPMNDLVQLQRAANRDERDAARRLALSTGVTQAQALRRVLENSAGDGGLAALLSARAALRAAEDERALARRARKAAALAQRKLRQAGAPTAWRAWFDGSAHPNPGRCSIGALLLGPQGESIELSLAAGYGNSSEAEYRALIAVLEAAVRRSAHELTIYGDSRVVIDDVNGPAHAAARSLLAYRSAARALLDQLRGVTLRWVPRHRNTHADALSQRAAALPHESFDDIVSL